MESRITPSNTAPVAVADQYEVHQGDTLDVTTPGVLANDSDADQDPLTAELVNGPSNALGFVLNPDGSFSYQPLAGFTGTDQFSYQAYDGTDYSNTVNVILNVTNQVPNAVADLYSVHQGDTLDVPVAGVLANDSDPENDALIAVLANGPSNANAFELNDDGSFTYDPLPGFTGTDSFTYQAYDGADFSATVAVNIDVTNQAPVGADDDYYVVVDGDLTVSAIGGVLTNDSDADGDSLTAELYTSTTNGYLTLNSDGSFNYTPDQGFEGTDTFQYRAFDGAAYSPLITANIQVRQVGNTIVYTVNSTEDAADADLTDNTPRDNQGRATLRAAIQQANASQFALFKIEFAPGLANGTISLGIELPALDKHFTIDGSGAASLTIQRNPAVGNFRIFTINANRTVSMNDLDLANGRAIGPNNMPSSRGSAIRNSGTLTLENLNLFNNEASNLGGAIYNSQGADLTVEQTYIYSNKAGYGGGVYNSGQATIGASDVFDNEATTSGGGILNSANSVLHLCSVDVYANQSGLYGGGITNTGQLTVTNGILELNIVTGLNGAGGGLYNHTGTATLDYVSIKRNETEQVGGRGGGVYVHSGTVTATVCDFEENVGAIGSAGSWLPNATFTRTNCTVPAGQTMEEDS